MANILVVLMLVLTFSSASARERKIDMKHYGTSHDNEPPFSEEVGRTEELEDHDREYIRHVLKRAFMDESQIEEFLGAAKLKDVADQLSWTNIVHKLHSDKSANIQLVKKVFGSTSAGIDTRAEMTECQKDYNQFVQPVTNRLLNSLRDSTCTDENLSEAECDNKYGPRLHVRQNEEWGKRMIDAMAKIPEGIVEGKLHWPGAYEMCLEMEVQYNYTDEVNGTFLERRNFNGQYCRLRVTTPDIGISILFGACVPDTCTKEEVYEYIAQDNPFLVHFLNNTLGWNLTKVFCGQELDASTDTSFQAGIAVILTLFILMVASTIYDGFFRKIVAKQQVTNDKDDISSVTSKTSSSSSVGKLTIDMNEKHLRLKHRLELLFLGFSAYTNLRKIFTTKAKKGQLPVLNGIRYLTFVWVIYGGTYLFGPLYQECWITANTIGAVVNLPKEFFFQIVLNYPLNIDTFLTISGILVSYWFLKKFDENKSHLSVMFIVKYIVHRYWSLFPGMIMTLMFYTTTYRYLATGPLYPTDVGDADNCRTNWWVDILMVHNLVRREYLCLTWMFYVPLVFQLQIAVLVVLIPLVLKRVAGYVLLAAMYIAHIGATAGITTQLREDGDVGGLLTDFMMTPWCRAGPFIIGMAFGIILHDNKIAQKQERNEKVKINLVVVLLGWLIALGTLAAVVFSTYDEFKEGGKWWSDAAHVAYDTLAHSAWAVGICWIVFACSTGHGGVINTFLSSTLFLPLSRLVYVSLLTHAMMIFKYVYGNMTMLYIDKYHMTYMVYGHLIFTVGMGILFGLIWYFPLTWGVTKAFSCKTRTDWVLAGRHATVETILMPPIAEPSKNSYINSCTESPFMESTIQKNIYRQ